MHTHKIQFFSIVKTHFSNAPLLFSELWKLTPIFKLHSQNLMLFLQTQTFTPKQFNLCSNPNSPIKTLHSVLKSKLTYQNSSISAQIQTPHSKQFNLCSNPNSSLKTVQSVLKTELLTPNNSILAQNWTMLSNYAPTQSKLNTLLNSH